MGFLSLLNGIFKNTVIVVIIIIIVIIYQALEGAFNMEVKDT
jgi:hypothetical protein